MLLLIRTSDEREAAENPALWLVAGEENNQEVTIICGSDTDIRDHALEILNEGIMGKPRIKSMRCFGIFIDQEKGRFS